MHCPTEWDEQSMSYLIIEIKIVGLKNFMDNYTNPYFTGDLYNNSTSNRLVMTNLNDFTHIDEYIIWMKLPLGHDWPIQSSPSHKYFYFMNYHTLTAGKVSQNHQCHQVLFLLLHNQAILWPSVSLIIFGATVSLTIFHEDN